MELLKNIYKHKGLLFMALPALIMLFMFNYMPMFALVVAFKDFNYYEGILGGKWIGLNNFKLLVVSKDTTWRIIRNTIGYWALFTVIGTICKVTLAILLNECRFKLFARTAHTVMIFPTFVSWIAITFIVTALLDHKNGMINHLLAQFGIAPIQWYSSPEKWPATTLLMQNILSYLDNAPVENQKKQLVYMGSSPGDKEFIQNLGFCYENFVNYEELNPDMDVLVIGEIPKDTTKIRNFVNQGGSVLVFPQWKHKLEECDIAGQLLVHEMKIAMVKPGQINRQEALLKGIGPQLLNFRKELDLLGFSGGELNGLIFKIDGENGGKLIFSQVDWRALLKGAHTATEVVNVHQPKLNLYRFYRQLFTNLDMMTREELSEYLCH